MEPINENAKFRGGASSESNQPIRFAGSALGVQRHVCAFFHSADEEYRVLLPFIKEGFERGEKAFHIVDPNLREEHLQRLRVAGIDVAAAEKSGQFEPAQLGECVFARRAFRSGEDACFDPGGSRRRQTPRLHADSSGCAHGMGPGRPARC
jgi:hypothetical protein